MVRWQRDAGKERAWRRHIAGWQRSGMSIRDYCAAEGLAEHNFHAWRKTLAERDRREAPRAKRSQSSTAIPAFVPIHVVNDEATSSPGGAVEVLLANGRVLRIRADFDPQVVRQLLALLEEPAC
jgi:transposase